MQALDSFISPIPSFDGDIPILTVSVLAWSPGDEPTSDPSTGANAGTSNMGWQTKSGYQPDFSEES
jgi:hypothetical protein